MLELHELKDGEPYWIGLFLGGAYQEVMGNLLNLFGSTNAVSIRLSPGGPYRVEHVVRGQTNSDVLEAMEHNPEALLARAAPASEAAIGSGDLSISDAQALDATPGGQPSADHLLRRDPHQGEPNSWIPAQK